MPGCACHALSFSFFRFGNIAQPITAFFCELPTSAVSCALYQATLFGVAKLRIHRCRRAANIAKMVFHHAAKHWSLAQQRQNKIAAVHFKFSIWLALFQLAIGLLLAFTF